MTDTDNWLDHYKIGSTELDGVYLTCSHCPNWDTDNLDGRTIPQLIDLATDHEIRTHGLLERTPPQVTTPPMPTVEELQKSSGAWPNQLAVALLLHANGINPYQVPLTDEALTHSGYLVNTGHITHDNDMQFLRIPWQLDTGTVQQILDAWATCIRRD